MKSLKCFFLVVMMLFPLTLLAEVPVMEATPSTSSNDMSQTTTNLDSSDQLKQVSQQVQNLQQMNLPGKIQQLEQAIQDLRGIVETQGHEIDQLKSQQKSTYSDLDQRLSAMKKTSIASVPVTNGMSQPSSQTGLQIMQPTSQTSSDETSVYRSAFVLIQKKQYTDAIASLQKYLSQYPKGQYAGNANYWLGELYAISGQNDQATKALNTVVQDYSTSNKVPDAMLKLGSMAYDQSEWQDAQQWWQKVVNQYPNSSAAQVAKVQLKQLER
ncbi:MAG: tol-pal system protein YbgF, partial [Gammaproteobacteria bacterium]|nr:tol-pal system protein YbgF [Gammaproteobacteria bacterium]